MNPTALRFIAIAGLVLAALVGLPLWAAVLDGSSSTENLIIPVHLVAMMLLGAAATAAVPALASPDVSGNARLLIGAGWGLLAAIVGLLVFWFLLNGLGGA